MMGMIAAFEQNLTGEFVKAAFSCKFMELSDFFWAAAAFRARENPHCSSSLVRIFLFSVGELLFAYYSFSAACMPLISGSSTSCSETWN
jgi:hypothetical protein